MLNLRKRIPPVRALLIAACLPMLPGCVSEPKKLDAAEAVLPAASDSLEETASTPTADQPAGAYRDPLVTQVGSGVPRQADAEATAALPGTATTAPANIAGLAMQPTAIDAHSSSIFSAPRPAPAAGDNNNDAAPAPAQPAPMRISPASSSVYSTPSPVVAPGRPEENSQHQSSQNGSRVPPAARPEALNASNLSGKAITALYSPPRPTPANFLAGLLHKAALPGLTRVAPNGLHVQTEEVQVGCFKPGLVKMIKGAEAHFGRPVLVTSGYRDESHNRLVGGADESLHKSCDAADIQIDGISKWDLAAYLRSLPGRGGIGTYCHTESVHLDTGAPRDWNWACRANVSKGSSGEAI